MRNLAFLPVCAGASLGATLMVERGSDLQMVINYANDGDTIVVSTKSFEGRPTAFTDSLCGNCLNPKTAVTGSFGFIVRGKSVVILGKDRSESRLVTKAGYGLYFVDSPSSTVANLTITGGRRDDDPNATNAAVVVRRSKVLIDGVNIVDNTHRSPDTGVVVGIGGIMGREGAEIEIVNCRIVNNGWDGLALYRGAIATITDCLIKDGRGAGIGITWDAACVAYRNEVTGYWKGIGAFGTSWVIARNNLVRDNLGWGIIATGQSYMDITNNVVYHNGNCGIAPWSTDSRGRIVNNIVSENGWRDRWVCPCVGVWNYGDWAKWEFSHNIVWHNRDGEYRDIWDQTGLNGNLCEDPLFVDDSSFFLREGSPALNRGDTTIFNIDGSVSHIGLHGGPQADHRQ